VFAVIFIEIMSDITDSSIKKRRKLFDPLPMLPFEVSAVIVDHFEVHDIVHNISFVCKAWRETFLSNYTWGPLFNKKYSEENITGKVDKAVFCMVDKNLLPSSIKTEHYWYDMFRLCDIVLSDLKDDIGYDQEGTYINEFGTNILKNLFADAVLLDQSMFGDRIKMARLDAKAKAIIEIFSMKRAIASFDGSDISTKINSFNSAVDILQLAQARHASIVPTGRSAESIFVGQVINGRPAGFGRIHVPEIGRFHGTMIDGDFVKGQLDTIYNTIYDGEFKGNVSHGLGKIYHPSIEDQEDGESDGFYRVVFAGQFVKGNKNGPGKEYNYNFNKVIYAGNYLNNLRHGEGTEFNNSMNIVFEGVYANGYRKQGCLRRYVPSKKLYIQCEGSFKRDDLHGNAKISAWKSDDGSWEKAHEYVGKFVSVFNKGSCCFLGDGGCWKLYNAQDELIMMYNSFETFRTISKRFEELAYPGIGSAQNAIVIEDDEEVVFEDY
jgi:hypothetical protein